MSLVKYRYIGNEYTYVELDSWDRCKVDSGQIVASSKDEKYFTNNGFEKVGAVRVQDIKQSIEWLELVIKGKKSDYEERKAKVQERADNEKELLDQECTKELYAIQSTMSDLESQMKRSTEDETIVNVVAQMPWIVNIPQEEVTKKETTKKTKA